MSEDNQDDKNRLSVIITRGGDKGTTSLGGGTRVAKDDLRVEAYGSTDELNSVIGLVRAVSDLDARLEEPLSEIQHDLFTLGGELCFTEEDAKKYDIRLMQPDMVDRLEAWAAEFNEGMAPLKEFTLPAGPHGAAELHLARTVCRRAERRVVTLAARDTVRPEAIQYLNRLSDLLFIWSRWVLESRGVPVVLWNRPR